jgi:hypothetical protein
MKFIITILYASVVAYASNSFGAISRTTDLPGVNASLKSSLIIKVREFVKLTPNQLSVISGKKLTIWNKVSFYLLKRRMKHALKYNPNLTVNDYFATQKDPHKSSLGVGLAIIFGVLILLLIFAVIRLMANT